MLLVLLTNWQVDDAWRQEKFDGLADPNFGEDFDKVDPVSLVELALWCMRKSSMERQFMRQVVERLHDVGLASSEPRQPEIELGDEHQRNAMANELLIMDSENFIMHTLILCSSVH